MTYKRISVVIPHFRRLDVVAEAIASVLRQTLLPDEILIVDDASGTDEVHQLCDISDKIRVVRLLQNQGVSFARNVGAATATGEWIAFLDSDDLWEPTKLAEQWAYVESHPECSGVHTGCVSFYPDGTSRTYNTKPLTLTIEDLVKCSHLVVPSLIMRRDVFLAVGGFDLKFRQTEDYEFSMRVVSAGYRIDFLPSLLVRIRYGREDKLSLNWIGYILGHAKVVWRYRSQYRKCGGMFYPWRQIASYIVKGGMKRGGFVGRLCRLVGYCCFPPLLWQPL